MDTPLNPSLRHFSLKIDDPLDVVRQIRATKMKAAVAINPGTPSSEISNELGEAVDMILVMTVWPGEFILK